MLIRCWDSSQKDKTKPEVELKLISLEIEDIYIWNFKFELKVDYFKFSLEANLSVEWNTWFKLEGYDNAD